MPLHPENLTQKKAALVRTGWHGELVCVEIAPSESGFGESELFSLDQIKRGNRVVVELGSGQQVAEFITFSRSNQSVVGRLVRRMEPQDEVRFGYLERFAQQAMDRYNAQLADDEQDCLLLAVEPQLDGVTLLLHFIHAGVPASNTALVLKLYDEETRTSEFFQKVEKGCGPNCGTSSAKGGCSTCKSCTTKCLTRKS